MCLLCITVLCVTVFVLKKYILHVLNSFLALYNVLIVCFVCILHLHHTPGRFPITQGRDQKAREEGKKTYEQTQAHTNLKTHLRMDSATIRTSLNQ